MPGSSPLNRAKSYPFDPPDHAYLFQNGQVTDWPQDQIPTDRHPVIACGSNASPVRLKEKFGNNSDAIPVTRGVLQDFAVAYSCHFATYGSIPATLFPDNAGTTELHITWLTDQQLHHMHKTEAIGMNYGFFDLSRIHLHHQSGDVGHQAFVYVSLHGALFLDDKLTRTADVTQIAALTRAKDILAPKKALDDFLTEIVKDDDSRANNTRQLKKLGRKIKDPRLTRLL